MPTVPLGELNVDRRVWVRQKLSLDQVRCLVNDLVNGAKLPPLLVERSTKTIVGGNHRYVAYKQFFGEGWERQEVEVEWVDLPPFEEDPVAWKTAAILDNLHTAERLGYGDRNKAAAEMIDAGLDPESEEAARIARLLHFTDDGWREFYRTYLEASTRPARQEAERRRVPVRRPFKASVNDVQPPDAKITTVRAQLLARAAALLDVLQKVSPGMITAREREVLEKVAAAIKRLLAEAA